MLALPTTRLAVMGPAGKEFVYKDELRKMRAAVADMVKKGVAAAHRGRHGRGRRPRRTPRRKPLEWLKEQEAALNQRYEKELMNPNEGLALGSISSLVMPSDLREVLGENMHFLLRHYKPRPDERPAARIPLDRVPPLRSRRPRDPRWPRPTDFYRNNPLIHRDRRLGKSPSAWVRSFACEDLKPLIVCRGPIRKEAMDVFEEMGITHFGILLSEKDSIVYPNALAPELRQLTDPDRVHRVPDYSGANKEERVERISQIIQIAQDNGYDSIFAGYGFMAEDEELVAAIEKAGLKFIGPCSATQAGAGKKDEAKRTALRSACRVTPGIDNVTALTLLKKYPDPRAAARRWSRPRGWPCDTEDPRRTRSSRSRTWPTVLMASYEKGIDLYTIDELCAQVAERSRGACSRSIPQSRVRLKAIGGGGGKGQRILGARC